MERVKNAMSSDADSAKAALANLPQMTKLQGLLSSGTVNQGALAGVQNEFRSWAKVLGFSVDEKSLSDTQEAGSYMLQTIFDKIQRTKGAVTERENTMFQNMGPQIGKSKEANAAIMDGIIARMKYDVSAGTLERMYAGGQITLKEWQDKRNALVDSYENQLIETAAKAVKAGGSAAATNAKSKVNNFLGNP